MTRPGSVPESVSGPVRVDPELAVVVAVIGFIAVPLAIEPFNAADLRGLSSLGSVSDILTNVLGFLPLGIVLAWRGPWRAIALAAVISASAEIIQFVSPYRSPSVADFLCNTAGAALGVALMAAIGAPRLVFKATPLRALIAAGLALAGVAAGPALAPRALQRTLDQVIYMPRAALGLIRLNPRGVSEPGRLEARWRLDGDLKDSAAKENEGGLDVGAVGAPAFTHASQFVLGPAPGGQGMRFDSAHDYLVAPQARALELAGDMTLTAWISPSARMRGNGAIVSTMSHLERGYEFYVSDDQDFRSIALQLGSPTGAVVTRYGRTEIADDRWTFVAAVYDAPHAALRVYVDGVADDACLVGPPGQRQTVSSAPLHIARHGEDEVDYFNGALADVRVYSSALSGGEIAALYDETRAGAGRRGDQTVRDDISCPSPPAQDPTSIGWLVVLGQLVALALLGFWVDRTNRVAGLALWGFGFLALLRVVLTSELLPIPLLALMLALAGAASVIAGARAKPDGSTPG